MIHAIAETIAYDERHPPVAGELAFEPEAPVVFVPVAIGVEVESLAIYDHIPARRVGFVSDQNNGRETAKYFDKVHALFAKQGSCQTAKLLFWLMFELPVIGQV